MREKQWHSGYHNNNGLWRSIDDRVLTVRGPQRLLERKTD